MEEWDDWTRWSIPNGKYDLNTQKEILKCLNFNDFIFIDNFIKNYRLREGIGIKNMLALMLGEYKFRTKLKKEKKE